MISEGTKSQEDQDLYKREKEVYIEGHMKICPICGYANPDDAVYCGRCGYKFPTPSYQQPQPSPQQPTPQPQPGYYQPTPGYNQPQPQQPPPYYPQPSVPSGYGLTPDEINGLKKIKNFGLFNIIALILVAIGLIIIFPSIGSLAGGTFTPTGHPSPGSLLVGAGGTLAAIGLIIVGAILALASFFYLMSGYSSLRRVDSEFNLPYYGLWLDIIGVIIAILGSIGLAAATIGTTNVGFLGSIYGLYVLVAILGFIGYILGYIVGAFRLSNRYNEGNFKLAGIMYIVGIFIGIFTLVGVILMYLGAKKVLSRAGVQ